MNTTIGNLVVIALLCGLASCVSNKKIVYLQDQEKGNGHKRFEPVSYPATSPDYILETNDIVSVKINHLQLTQDYQQVSEDFDTQMRMGIQHPMLIGFTIDDNGMVDLPTIGKVELAGLTIFQAQEAISDKAKQYFTNYAVKVFLLNSYVSVIGEVQRPGRFPFYVNELNIMEALSMAGDLSEYADRQHVRIIRDRGEKNEVIVVDLNDRELLTNPAYHLQPNDIIVVNPLSSKKFIRRDPQNIFNAISTLVSVATLFVLITR
ncbi:MAG: hypothetical protein HKN79_05000 [Flavobacteriales bacterium]|nr:hypothetical protein [Flavobacteriales bacterium]